MFGSLDPNKGTGYDIAAISDKVRRTAHQAAPCVISNSTSMVHSSRTGCYRVPKVTSNRISGSILQSAHAAVACALRSMQAAITVLCGAVLCVLAKAQLCSAAQLHPCQRSVSLLLACRPLTMLAPAAAAMRSPAARTAT